MVAQWLNRLIAEIVKTLVLSVKITGYLLWYSGLGLIASYRKLSAWYQDRSLRSSSVGGSGSQACPACGVVNGPGQARCFACGGPM